MTPMGEPMLELMLTCASGSLEASPPPLPAELTPEFKNQLAELEAQFFFFFFFEGERRMD